MCFLTDTSSSPLKRPDSATVRKPRVLIADGFDEEFNEPEGRSLPSAGDDLRNAVKRDGPKFRPLPSDNLSGHRSATLSLKHSYKEPLAQILQQAAGSVG